MLSIPKHTIQAVNSTLGKGRGKTVFRPIINDLTEGFKWLIDLIPTGQYEAVSMTDLARMSGLPSADIRQQVLNARLKGVLICSGEQGYYFPGSYEELTDYVFRRYKYIQTATFALLPFVKEMEGDLLDEGVGLDEGDQEEGDPG
jgi:hypothetical protein